MKATKATVRKFLKTHSLGVISTVTESGVPLTSSVFYIYTDDEKIRFATKNRTTKFNNLEKNNKVAMTVNDRAQPIAVNLVGEASIVEEDSEIHATLKALGEIHMGNHIQPVLKHRKGDFVIIEINPTDIQYTDYTRPFIGENQYIDEV